MEPSRPVTPAAAAGGNFSIHDTGSLIYPPSVLIGRSLFAGNDYRPVSRPSSIYSDPTDDSDYRTGSSMSNRGFMTPTPTNGDSGIVSSPALSRT